MDPSRRRADDTSWEASKQRKPWDGPTSRWGEDVNTRLGTLEIGMAEVTEQLKKNNQLAGELLEVFYRSKKLGLAIIGILAFLGYSGIISIWNWIQSHLK